MASGNIKHYLARGDAANRPDTLDLSPNTVGFWYSEDTGQWSAWNGTAWMEDIMGGGGTGGSDAISEVAVSGGVATVNCASGSAKNHTLALGANATMAVSNLAGVGIATEFELQITASGAFTLTLPSAFRPLGGSDTAITAPGVTILSAKTFDNGTTWSYAMQERG